MKRLALAFALLLPVTLVNCGAPVTSTSPAPVQSADLAIAKALLVAQDTIESLTPLVTAHPDLKGPVNQARANYTTLKNAYLVFHNAVLAGSNPDSAKLASDIQQLIGSVQGLVALYKGN